MPLTVRGRNYSAIAAALMLAGLGYGSLVQAQSAKTTYSFAVVSWTSANYETAGGKEECPDGFAIDNMQIYLDTLTPEARDKFTAKGAKDITFDFQSRRLSAERGPQGQDICWNPTAVKDPPMRTIKGKKGFGLNLDGAGDGKAAPNACPHKNFSSPTGETGIDNQWYRLVGCTLGWRSVDGYMEKNPNGELRDSGHAILIEVSGVTDLKNSQDVRVAFAQAVEPLAKDSTGTGNIIANASYRVADNHTVVTRGKIENGVLTTDPVDVRFPFYGNTVYAEHFIRGTRLQLNLTADGKSAKGMLAGYYDLETFWDYISRAEYLQAFAHFSCPALYKAAHELADGYPDPATGQCTALSAAFNIEAVGAYVIHPQSSAQR